MSVETTVIIPTCNRPERLRDCLSALMQTAAATVEVIVVDDGGTVELTSVIAPFPEVRLIRQDNQGPATARNIGAQAARGEWLIFTDDDCIPTERWLATMVDACRRNPTALVGGSVENILCDNPYSAASQALCDFLLVFFEQHPSSMAFFTSNCIACSKEAYLAIGGFDTTFPLPAAEDRDFGMRWAASGRRMLFVREAVVGHSHHLTLKSYFRQHANYGRGARHLHRLIRARGKSPFSIEWSGFHLRLLMHPFRSGARHPLRQSSLIVMSQLAMLCGYVSETFRPGRRSAGVPGQRRGV